MNEPQEGAQTPEARIEDVLREHQPVWAASIDMLVRCDCGHGHDIAGYDQDGHNAHVAAAVFLALGLTPEYGVITDMGVNHPSLSRLSREGVQSLAAKYDDITPRTRLVTKWEQQT